MTHRILVVEDDGDIASNLGLLLHEAGYGVEVVSDGFEALVRASVDPPDLVVLDLGLPGLSGEDVLRRLREVTDVPVVILTANDTAGIRLGAFLEGASDFLAKPYEDSTVLACVSRRLRGRGGDLTVGPLVLDEVRGRAYVDGRELPLAPQEFALLGLLVRQPGRIFDTTTLADALDLPLTDASWTVGALVQRLREALASAGQPKLLRVVPEFGIGIVPLEPRPSAGYDGLAALRADRHD